MNETLLKQIGVWLIAGAFATLVGLASAILPGGWLSLCSCCRCLLRPAGVGR